MCHDPLIRMCVRSTRSPEKTISRCLPRADTRSMVRPRSGWSRSMRVRWGKTDSKPVTVRPASARWSARAARNTVSPSGIPEVVAVAFPVRTIRVDVVSGTAADRFVVPAVVLRLHVLLFDLTVVIDRAAHALLLALQVFLSAWLGVTDECRIVLETVLVGHFMSSGRGRRNADASRVQSVMRSAPGTNSRWQPHNGPSRAV